MFNSSILDLIILLSFIYFIGSLVLSAVNEAIAGTLRLRPYQLKNALTNLFFDNGDPKDLKKDQVSTNPEPVGKAPDLQNTESSDWKTWINEKFVKSPHIQSLMKASDKYPAYIPARSFVMAVIGELGSEKYTSPNLLLTIKDASLPKGLKKVLIDLAAQAQNNHDKFEKNLAEFYTEALDRAGGVYKKWIRLLLLILGFIFSVVLNLDTIKIINEQLSNKEQLSKNIDRIASQMSSIKISKDSTETISITAKDGVIAIKRQQMALDTSQVADPNQKADKAKEAIIKNTIGTVKQLSTYLTETSGYNIGYESCESFKNQWTFCKWSGFPLKFLGILITAFALQLSSSFWFDLINKSINIRAAGKKPDTKNQS